MKLNMEIMKCTWLNTSNKLEDLEIKIKRYMKVTPMIGISYLMMQEDHNVNVISAENHSKV